jgi:hypothetical protein
MKLRPDLENPLAITAFSILLGNMFLPAALMMISLLAIDDGQVAIRADRADLAGPVR